MRVCVRLGFVLVALLVAACKRDAPSAPQPAATPAPATVPATAPASAAQSVFSREELDQMVAPIALYPDSLLTQVLMAATYPANVADAVAWSKAHPQATGDDAVKQVADQPWDPSVQSLVAFPQVMATLGQDPGWVQRLGDAFLAQPGDVMDAVQRLRRAAQAAGNLQSTEQQTVTVSPAPTPSAAPAPAPADGSAPPPPPPASDTIIEIAPADPQVVYVPSYNPTTVYGTWPYPSYPPVYYPPAPTWYPGSALVAGLAFGTGVAVADALWGDWDWNDHDVDIDVNRYNNINVNRQLDVNNNVWRHNAEFRGNVPYRDARSREQFGPQRLPGAENREAFRGNDPAHAANRERARQELQQRGFGTPAADNRAAREQARTAGRDLRERPEGGLDARNAGAAARRDAGGADAARERARSVADARTQRPSGGSDHAQAGARQNGPRTTHANQQVREQHRQQHAQTARTQPTRQHADAQRVQQRAQQPRMQPSHSLPHQGARNNAFAGVDRPAQTRAQVDRGRSSHAMAQRPQSARSGGHQVQRAPHGGGGRRRG